MNSFKTPDGLDLYSSQLWCDNSAFYNWLHKFSNDNGLGKFNIWNCPTKWPRKRWSAIALIFSMKLIYRKDKIASRLWYRGLRAQKNLEKMRYYYAD